MYKIGLSTCETPVTEELFKKYNTPEAFASMDPSELENEIYSCGF